MGVAAGAVQAGMQGCTSVRRAGLRYIVTIEVRLVRHRRTRSTLTSWILLTLEEPKDTNLARKQ